MPSPAPHHVQDIPLTHHAWRRLSQRGVHAAAIDAAFTHGREVYLRGACIRVIGRKEVARAGRRGCDIARHQGVHLVCAHDGQVLTLYRNQRLDIRPRRRRARRAA